MGGDVGAVHQQRGFGYLMARFEVVVEVPLLGGGEFREEAVAVEPDSAELLVSLMVLIVGEAGHLLLRYARSSGL